MFARVLNTIKSGNKTDAMKLRVNVCLPALFVQANEEKSKNSLRYDSSYSIEDSLSILREHWTEEELQGLFLKRFLKVVCDGGLRAEMLRVLAAQPDMTEQDLEEHLQAYADDTWNVNMAFPSERKSKSPQEKVLAYYLKMSPSEQEAFKSSLK